MVYNQVILHTEYSSVSVRVQFLPCKIIKPEHKRTYTMLHVNQNDIEY